MFVEILKNILMKFEGFWENFRKFSIIIIKTYELYQGTLIFTVVRKTLNRHYTKLKKVLVISVISAGGSLWPTVTLKFVLS